MLAFKRVNCEAELRQSSDKGLCMSQAERLDQQVAVATAMSLDATSKNNKGAPSGVIPHVNNVQLISKQRYVDSTFSCFQAMDPLLVLCSGLFSS